MLVLVLVVLVVLGGSISSIGIGSVCCIRTVGVGTVVLSVLVVLVFLIV